MIAKANNERLPVARGAALPENLPAGAKAFQAAVDGKLTQEVWEQILNAQIEKAKGGDRGAAKFLLEYAGGVASMRGATFVQEHHQHNHYHEHDGSVPAPRSDGEQADLSPEDYEASRLRHARRATARAAVRGVA